ncbi:MAG: hypothetical protein K6L73_07415 [Cellvibrionaceae bacterium]
MYKFFCLISALFILQGCGEKELPYKALIKESGLYYDSQTGELFTGLARDTSSILYSLLFAIDATNYHASRDIQCTSQFEQGELHGKTLCEHRDGYKLAEINISHDKLEGDFEVYHIDTGEPYIALSYINGKRDEWMRTYNEDGDLIHEILYDQGKTTGNETKWTKNAKHKILEIDDRNGFKWKLSTNNTICRIEYVDLTEHGKKECFHSTIFPLSIDSFLETTNKTPISKEIYKDGSLDGLSQHWYPDGKQKSETTYKEGTISKYKSWSSSGILTNDIEYLNEGNKKGFETVVEWKSLCTTQHNGETRTTKCFVKESNDKKEPIKGTPISEASYKGDSKNGTSKEWHSNGKQKLQENHLNGILHGPSKKWTSSGQLTYDIIFNKGNIESGFEVAISNYNVCFKNYTNGKDSFNSECFENKSTDKHSFSKGFPTSSETKTNGKLNGPQKTWDSKGQLINEKIYENGSLTKETDHFWKDGKIIFSNHFKKIASSSEDKTEESFSRDGTYTFDCGDKLYTQNWKNGKLINGTYASCGNYTLEFIPHKSIDYNAKYYQLTPHGEEAFYNRKTGIKEYTATWKNGEIVAATSFLGKCKNTGCIYNRPKGQDNADWLRRMLGKEFPYMARFHFDKERKLEINTVKPKTIFINYNTRRS